jgi:16S rRNA processing protein RimM
VNKQACFELGYIAKPFGLKGQVTAVFDVDNPLTYKNLESVFVETDNTLIPFFVEELKMDHQGRITLHFEDISNVDQAGELKGCKLFLPLDMLPESKGEDIYLHEYLGLQVIDNENELGKIIDYNEASAQIILVMEYKSKEVLFPLIDEVVTKVDKGAQQLFVQLPEGLLDVYLSEE